MDESLNPQMRLFPEEALNRSGLPVLFEVTLLHPSSSWGHGVITCTQDLCQFMVLRGRTKKKKNPAFLLGFLLTETKRKESGKTSVLSAH